MAKLTLQDVKHVARLSQLSLTKKEEIKFKKQLSDVLAYIDQLSQVDTNNVAPTSQITGLENVVRKDLVNQEDLLTHDEVLSGTEELDNGYFIIPIILKEKTV